MKTSDLGTPRPTLIRRIINSIRHHVGRAISAILLAVITALIVTYFISPSIARWFGPGSSGGEVVLAVPSPCSEDEQEPDDSSQENLTILATEICADRQIVNKDVDYYNIKDVPNEADTWVNIKHTGDETQRDEGEGIFRASLFGPGPESLEDSPVDSDDCSTDIWFSILTNNTLGGDYYLKVEGCSGTDTEHTYSVETQVLGDRSTQDDGDSGRDAGDSVEKATCLTDNFEQGECSTKAKGGTGSVGPRDPEDYYKFEAKSDTVLKITHVSDYELGIFFRHVDAEKEDKVTTERAQDNVQFKTAEVRFDKLLQGTYFLRVSYKLTNDDDAIGDIKNYCAWVVKGTRDGSGAPEDCS